MFCGKCCEDVQLPILHLIFPTAYLDEPGLAFYRAHGLDDLIAKKQDVKFEWKGMVITINTLGLIRPDVYLDANGQAFYEEHHLNELIQSNDLVKVFHRCQHLQSDQSCGIYESRPIICQAFNCALRDDCSMDNVYPLTLRR